MLQCNELNRGQPTFFSQSQDEFRTKESEFVHFGRRDEVKPDWELMRKAMLKWFATLLFTAKCWSFSRNKLKQINIFTNQMWASNAKEEFNANVFTEWQPGRVQQIYLP